MEIKTSSDCRACVLNHTHHYAGFLSLSLQWTGPWQSGVPRQGDVLQPGPSAKLPALLSPEFNRVYKVFLLLWCLPNLKPVL